MARILLSLLAAAIFSINAFAQDAAENYDGTGVQPPKELLLQDGTLVGDIRMPKGTKFDTDKSVILGSGVNSYGRIIGSVSSPTSRVVRFFLDSMPTNGWELISEYQDDDIMMVYQKPTRVVVIIMERNKRSTNLRMTMTPRS